MLLSAGLSLMPNVYPAEPIPMIYPCPGTSVACVCMCVCLYTGMCTHVGLFVHICAYMYVHLRVLALLPLFELTEKP